MPNFVLYCLINTFPYYLANNIFINDLGCNSGL